MTTDTGFAVSTSRDATAAEPFAAGTIQWLRRAGEGGRETLSAGYWFVTPTDLPPKFELPIPVDETIYIVEGRILIEVDGVEHDVRAGGSLSVNAGATTLWTVLEDTIEFFVYS
ncbi:MAG TPA: cupin domain-containing protein [Pseudolysinimonas sp.]|nr:cupin domain-containing protein [Pseudolysinimonas sp.]